MSFHLQLHQQLDHAVLEQMHETAVAMVARTGFKVDHAEIRAELLRHEGFAEKNGRICITPARVERWLTDFRATQTYTPTEAAQKRPFRFFVDNRAFWVVDRDGVTVRPMKRADVIDGTKLIEMLHQRGVQGSTPGFPTDVPTLLQPIEQYLLSAEYSSAGGDTCQITDIPTAEIIREMNRVYGRKLDLSVYVPSPLEFSGNELEILWHFRQEITSTFVGSMPIMGLTGPCDIIGIFTLAIAETIGGATMLHALLPGANIGIFPHPEPAYMGSGSIIFGTPEWQLLDAMHRNVFNYYGMAYTGKNCYTTAAYPNAQAQIERTAGILLSVLSGADTSGALGLMSNDEVWSGVQALLDLEIGDYALRLADGAIKSEGYTLETLPELVDSVIQSGQLFVEDESTVLNMRRQYQQPHLLQRMAYAQWDAAGRPDVVQQAQIRVDDLVAQYQYQPPPEILRDLRTIYERSCARLSVPATREWRMT